MTPSISCCLMPQDLPWTAPSPPQLRLSMQTFKSLALAHTTQRFQLIPLESSLASRLLVYVLPRSRKRICSYGCVQLTRAARGDVKLASGGISPVTIDLSSLPTPAAFEMESGVAPSSWMHLPSLDMTCKMLSTVVLVLRLCSGRLHLLTDCGLISE